MTKLLCPSMMCADFSCLKDEVKQLDEAGIDIFHCDVMDGQFVPNMTMGIKDIEAIRKHTDKLVDCHLMMEHPAQHIDLFIQAGCDLLYIHPEAERYTGKALMTIKEKGKLAGLAINPDTSLASVEELLPLADYVMVMTVNPGFAGQAFLESTKRKIKQLVAWKSTWDFNVMIDGACSPHIIQELSALGCDGFVLGTSALFNKGMAYQTLINELRQKM